MTIFTRDHEVHQEKSRLQESLSYAWQAPEMALRRVGSEIRRKGNVGRIGILNFVCSDSKKLLQRQADVARRANRLLQRQAARGAVV